MNLAFKVTNLASKVTNLAFEVTNLASEEENLSSEATIHGSELTNILPEVGRGELGFLFFFRASCIAAKSEKRQMPNWSVLTISGF